MKRWHAPAVTLLLFSVGGGCASDIPPESPVAPVSQVGQSSAAAAGADADDAATKYFTALVSNDPDIMEAGQAYAAPTSIAAGYLKHLTMYEGALLDNGEVDDPEHMTSGDGSWGYCPADVEAGSSKCVEWAGVTFSGGKVAAFTVNGNDISKRISLGDGDKLKVGSMAEVTFISAYQSVSSKSVVVTFEFMAQKALIMNYDGAKYRGPDGRQASATSAGGPSDLAKDSTARGWVAFKGAKPGGVVTLDVYDSDYNDHYLKVKTS